jgi:hypothetical protein
MRIKSRFLRILLTCVVILLFTGYFAFSTLLFSPLESAYEYDVSSLIPRNVDFYFAKADLSDDFDPLPRLAFADDFEASEHARELLALPAYRNLMEELGVEEALASIEESLEELPAAVDPLAVLGGSDLALAGHFRGAALDQADWTLYARTNWMGKLIVELLRYPGLLDLEERGLSVVEEEDWVQLSGGQLARTLYVTRIRDVIVLGTTAEMVAQAHELEASRGENSLGLSAKYGDNIEKSTREGDELEAYLDYRAFAENKMLAGTWPDTLSEDFAEALVGKFWQIGSVRELMGILGFGTGVSLRLSGVISSETMTPVQGRLCRTRGFDRAQVVGPQQLASLIPADVGAFGYLHIHIGDLVRQAMGTAEDALVSNLEDLVRQAWGYADLHPLIDDVSTAFRDRIAFCLTENDYPDDPDSDGDGFSDGPPHNTIPTYAWALVLWVADMEKVQEIRARIHHNQGVFGIQGRTPGSKGVFENKVRGGHQVYEYWQPMIDGTGHIATLRMNELFVISNHHKLLDEIVGTYYGGEQEAARLSEDPWFLTQVNAGLPSVNLLLWLNPRAVSDTRMTFARERARDDLAIDWSIERPRIEKLLLKEHFPGERWGALSPGIEEQLALYYDEAADEFEREFRGQHEPALRARYEREVRASEILRGALFELAIGTKELDLFARLITPLD